MGIRFPSVRGGGRGHRTPRDPDHPAESDHPADYDEHAVRVTGAKGEAAGVRAVLVAPAIPAAARADAISDPAFVAARAAALKSLGAAA